MQRRGGFAMACRVSAKLSCRSARKSGLKKKMIVGIEVWNLHKDVIDHCDISCLLPAQHQSPNPENITGRK